MLTSCQATARFANVSLQPISADDLPFLQHLYATSRAEEMQQVPWTAQEKAAFLAFQFAAQHHHYMQFLAGADFMLIRQQGQPVGRLYVDRRPAELRVVDIALLPEARNLGLGTYLMSALIEEARNKVVPLTIHVEQTNPAMRLYQRLGFTGGTTEGVYRQMTLIPAEA